MADNIITNVEFSLDTSSCKFSWTKISYNNKKIWVYAPVDDPVTWVARLRIDFDSTWFGTYGNELINQSYLTLNTQPVTIYETVSGSSSVVFKYNIGQYAIRSGVFQSRDTNSINIELNYAGTTGALDKYQISILGTVKLEVNSNTVGFPGVNLYTVVQELDHDGDTYNTIQSTSFTALPLYALHGESTAPLKPIVRFIKAYDKKCVARITLPYPISNTKVAQSDYISIGASLDNPARITKIIDNTDVTVEISYSASKVQTVKCFPYMMDYTKYDNVSIMAFSNYETVLIFNTSPSNEILFRKQDLAVASTEFIETSDDKSQLLFQKGGRVWAHDFIESDVGIYINNDYSIIANDFLEVLG